MDIQFRAWAEVIQECKKTAHVLLLLLLLLLLSLLSLLSGDTGSVSMLSYDVRHGRASLFHEEKIFTYLSQKYFLYSFLVSCELTNWDRFLMSTKCPALSSPRIRGLCICSFFSLFRIGPFHWCRRLMEMSFRICHFLIWLNVIGNSMSARLKTDV